MSVDDRLREALERSAELDAKKITVETSNGTVTLKGYVRSWAEKQDAEALAIVDPIVSAFTPVSEALDELSESLAVGGNTPTRAQR